MIWVYSILGYFAIAVVVITLGHAFEWFECDKPNITKESKATNENVDRICFGVFWGITIPFITLFTVFSCVFYHIPIAIGNVPKKIISHIRTNKERKQREHKEATNRRNDRLLRRSREVESVSRRCDEMQRELDKAERETKAKEQGELGS